MSREAAIVTLTEALMMLPCDRPSSVAVNGRIASGKTSLADELAGALNAAGRKARRIGVDGFHNPKSVRYRQGRSSARGYYEDAYDLEALKRSILVPIVGPTESPAGGWLIYTSSLDLETDTPIQPAPETVSAGEILLIDGSFLLRPIIREHWDYKIFVDVKRDFALHRGVQRDAATLGGIDQAERLHEERYQAACDLYLSENEPARFADVVIDNNVIDRPALSGI